MHACMHACLQLPCDPIAHLQAQGLTRLDDLCSITRTDLGPYRQKVLYIPAVYLITTLVRLPPELSLHISH